MRISDWSSDVCSSDLLNRKIITSAQSYQRRLVFMRAMKVGNPATLDSLELVNLPEPGQPGPGEILVKLYASSLNYKDYMVAEGLLPVESTEERREGKGCVSKCRYWWWTSNENK